MRSNNIYYLNEAGQVEGPFTKDDLFSLIQSGDITSKTLVAHEGDAEWIPASEMCSQQSEVKALPARPAVPGARTVHGQRAGGAKLNRPSEAELDLWGSFIFTLTQNYVNFSGRATRKEYFSYTLCALMGSLILLILPLAMSRGEGKMEIAMLFVIASQLIYWLALFLPSLAVLARRLNDIGWPGMVLALLQLVPYVGSLVALGALVGIFIDSERKTNQYGPSPKYPDAA